MTNRVSYSPAAIERSVLTDTRPVQIVRSENAGNDARPLDFCARGILGVVERLTIPLKTDGVRVSVRCSTSSGDVDRRTAVLAYRAAAALLDDVHHHQSVSEVTLTLGCDGIWLHLEVLDNRVGFDVTPTTETSTDSLRALLYRVCEAHGLMRTRSTPAGCTQVAVALPVNRPTAQK